MERQPLEVDWEALARDITAHNEAVRADRDEKPLPDPTPPGRGVPVTVRAHYGVNWQSNIGAM